MFTIEENIPVPKAGRTKTQDLAYEAMCKMKVGESFEFEGKKYQAIQQASKRVRQKNKTLEFQTRKINDKTRRVWRIK